jgi:hypothetical protein
MGARGMISPGWRVAAASVAGAAHVRRGIGCQDAHQWRILNGAGSSQVLIAVLADGAGSASRAEAGAKLACAFILDAVESTLAGLAGVVGVGGLAGGASPRDIDRCRVEIWLAGLAAETALLAADQGLAPREFASTLLAAVVAEDCAAFFQVGDGAIVVDAVPPGEGYDCVFWPAHEEYENVTFFAAEPNAAEHLQHALVDRRVEELALFSDGLQRLALDYTGQRAHTPFFRSMLSPLHAAAAGAAARGAERDGLSDSLAAFLDSPRVNDRTDDDKTLMLAVRARSLPDA